MGDHWQYFTEGEVDALTDALDQYIANQDATQDDLRIARALYYELVDRAVGDDG